MLRLTRWLTLCDKKRDTKGRVLGNIYIIHDEPISITDAIHFDSNYLTLLTESTIHNDKIVRDVANYIVDELKSDKNFYFISHIELMLSRLEQHEQSILQKDHSSQSAKQIINDILHKDSDQDILNNQKSAMELSQNSLNSQSSSTELNKNTQNNQSSYTKLSQNTTNTTSSIKELNPNTQNSTMEPSQNTRNNQDSAIEPSQNSTNIQSSAMEPSQKNTISSYSTSNVYNQYCTNSTINNILNNLYLNDTERTVILSLIKQLNLSNDIVEQVLSESLLRINMGNIQRPVNYICSLLNKAKRGNFNQYLIKNRIDTLPNQQRQQNYKQSSVLTAHKKHNSETRSAIIQQAQELDNKLKLHS
ncbi:STY4528 family pathogenicity island replication protein [Gallibacterium genomosp. 2]|uniref:STY4528 family pathogenicity island replication protein n=1 Tax=Gallibacterium genomosp. 2 TaxID=155517 RepID=UPI0012EB3EEE